MPIEMKTEKRLVHEPHRHPFGKNPVKPGNRAMEQADRGDESDSDRGPAAAGRGGHGARVRPVLQQDDGAGAGQPDRRRRRRVQRPAPAHRPARRPRLRRRSEKVRHILGAVTTKSATVCWKLGSKIRSLDQVDARLDAGHRLLVHVDHQRYGGVHGHPRRPRARRATLPGNSSGGTREKRLPL